MGDGSISEGPGLSSEGITATWSQALVAQEEEVALPEDGYEELTVTALRNMLSQREQPVYGNKEQLITRLRDWDSANPEGLIEEETDVIGEAEVTSEVVEEAPEAEPVPIDEGDESDGVEGE
jgi:hypothetical protein